MPFGDHYGYLYIIAHCFLIQLKHCNETFSQLIKAFTSPLMHIEFPAAATVICLE